MHFLMMLKNVLARGAPEYCKWHSCWETLNYLLLS